MPPHTAGCECHDHKWTERHTRFIFAYVAFLQTILSLGIIASRWGWLAD